MVSIPPKKADRKVGTGKQDIILHDVNSEMEEYYTGKLSFKSAKRFLKDHALELFVQELRDYEEGKMNPKQEKQFEMKFENQIRIYNYIIDNGPVTRKQIQDNLKLLSNHTAKRISNPTFTNHINILKGLVELKQDSKGRYSVQFTRNVEDLTNPDRTHTLLEFGPKTTPIKKHVLTVTRQKRGFDLFFPLSEEELKEWKEFQKEEERFWGNHLNLPYPLHGLWRIIKVITFLKSQIPDYSNYLLHRFLQLLICAKTKSLQYCLKKSIYSGYIDFNTYFIKGSFFIRWNEREIPL
jgi:hypothetical protein